MSKKNDSKKKGKEDRLGGFASLPAPILSLLLKKVSDFDFDESKGSPKKFLEKNWEDPMFAKKFTTLFDDYAKQECVREISEEDLNSFLLMLLKKTPDIDLGKRIESPAKFLEINLENLAFRKKFMDMFQEYANQEGGEDIMEEDLNLFLSAAIRLLSSEEVKREFDFSTMLFQEKWGDPGFPEKFMNMFDDYAKSGRAHIFFYYLPIEKKHITRLKDERELEGILKENRELIGKEIFSWGSAKPKLVDIRRRYHNGQEELWFKWIESRPWYERVSRGKSTLPSFSPRLERSANYFIIDLKKSIAQLRIQLIKPNAFRSLKNEYEMYRERIGSLINFKEKDKIIPMRFRRIELESVVKRFLFSKDIKPVTWEIWLPNGGSLTAKGRPELLIDFGKTAKILQGITLTVIKGLDFFGRKLVCECRLKDREWGPLDVKVKVDGEKDVITVYSACDQRQIRTIVGKAMKGKRNKIESDILKDFVKGKALLERIVLSFDYHFRRLKETSLRAGHLEDSEWFNKGRVRSAMRDLVDNAAKDFYIDGVGKNLTLYKKGKVKKAAKAAVTP